MSTSDMFVFFGPLLALSFGYAIMFLVMSYVQWKKGQNQ